MHDDENVRGEFRIGPEGFVFEIAGKPVLTIRFPLVDWVDYSGNQRVLKIRYLQIGTSRHLSQTFLIAEPLPRDLIPLLEVRVKEWRR